MIWPFRSKSAPPPAPRDASRPLLWMQLVGNQSGSGFGYRRAAEEGFRRNPIAHRCAQLIAAGIASLPWLVYARVGGRRREVEAGPLVDLLARPGPHQGTAAFFAETALHLTLGGNCWIHLVAADERAPPARMTPLAPERVSLVAGAHGPRWRYEPGGGRPPLVWEPDPITGAAPVLHLRRPEPLDPWLGQGDAAAAGDAIAQHNEAAAWNAGLLRNGARPSGALVFAPKEGDGLLTDQQAERLKQDLAEQYAGSGAAGRPLVLEGGLSWQTLQLSPRDMDWGAMKESVAIDIAAAFGVPAQLIGIRGAQTYANLAEARLALWEDTILPLAWLIRDGLTLHLAPRFGPDLVLDVDLDAIPALVERRQRAFAKLQGVSFLTVNEKRAAVGYGPLPDGDRLA